MPSLRSLLAVLVVAALSLTGCGAEDEDVAGPGGGEGATEVGSAAARISVDGEGDDWTSATLQHTDAEGDGQSLDLGRLWIANDDQYLFLRMEVGETVNLQEGNGLTLYLDTDNDASTGTSVQGQAVGAEVAWTFGRRRGTMHRNGEQTEIGHAELGFSSLPTVRSPVFEMALKRDATPGGAPLFRGDTLRVALTGGGDRLPDEGSVGYAFAEGASPVPPASLDPPGPDALRLVAHNTLFSSILKEAQPAYERILKALQPDVIGFQEVYDHGAAPVRDVVADAIVAGEGKTWHAAKLGLDLVTVSRYPILETHAIPGYESEDRNYQSGAFLLDTTEKMGTPLLFINAHPPCCNYDDAQPSRDVQRQQVVDGIAAFIRDVKQGEGPFDVPKNTPIVVTGDMNFVGSAQQPQTLRTGEIVHTERFGASAAPDWDGTDLLDTNPRQTATPLHVTWDDPGSSFPPGRLDYTYVSDSVLDVVNEFVLRTAALDDSILTAHGLRPDDTATASDHLPVVVDVR
jgi:endonuclease/exonuclease/phosphatase family metal-dependent hydrolase